MDVPGFGGSQPVAEPFSLPAAGDALLAAWEALGLERPVLVGHSMGGALVTDLAARHPGRVSRLGLVAAAGFERLQARRAAVLLPPRGRPPRRAARRGRPWGPRP